MEEGLPTADQSEPGAPRLILATDGLVKHTRKQNALCRKAAGIFAAAAQQWQTTRRASATAVAARSPCEHTFPSPPHVLQFCTRINWQQQSVKNAGHCPHACKRCCGASMPCCRRGHAHTHMAKLHTSPTRTHATLNPLQRLQGSIPLYLPLMMTDHTCNRHAPCLESS